MALAWGSACGGRTSALDSSIYDGSSDDDDDVSGTGGKGGAASGARGGVAGRAPTAGKAGARGGRGSSGGRGGAGGSGAGAGATGGVGTGAGGFGGSIGVGIEQINKVCDNHCGSYGFLCKESETKCPFDCQQELFGLTAECRKTAYDALACVDSFFTNGATCDASTSALAACQASLDAWHSCKGSRVVTPIPRGRPDPYVTSCSPLFNHNGVSCNATFSCVSGDYAVYCAFSPTSKQASCSCTSPAMAVSTGFAATDADPCLTAARLLCH